MKEQYEGQAIETAAEKRFRSDMLNAVGCVVGVPGGSQILQNELNELRFGTATDLETLMKALSFAHAALCVAETPDTGVPESWYRDAAKSLLHRAAAIVLTHEAMQQRYKEITH